jgi:ABC-type nitrate/sulfonate/bicarbonate transport system substrate-binding protein
MRIVQNLFLPNAALIAARHIAAFTAAGADVVDVFTRSSLDQRTALRSGECDVAVTALDNLFAWNETAGDRFRAVAQIERTTSLPVYLADASSLAELAERPTVRVVVDSPASGFGVALVALARSAGIDREQCEIVSAGGVHERLAALVAGEGDVALLAPFVAAAAHDAGLVRAGSVEDTFPDYPGLVVAVDRDKTANDDALHAYVRGLDAGRRWLTAHPDDALRVLVDSGLPEPTAQGQLALCGAGGMRVSAEGFRLLRRLRADQGVLPSIACDYDDFVLGGFAGTDDQED